MLGPKLPGAPAQPFPPQGAVNLFMWNRPASSGIGLASLYRLKDIQVIEDILDAAIVGQAIEESPHGVLCLHVHPLSCGPASASVARPIAYRRRAISLYDTTRH